MKHIMRSSKENHIISILINIIEPKLMLEGLLGDPILGLLITEVSNTTYTFLKKSHGMDPMNLSQRHIFITKKG